MRRLKCSAMIAVGIVNVLWVFLTPVEPFRVWEFVLICAANFAGLVIAYDVALELRREGRGI